MLKVIYSKRVRETMDDVLICSVCRSEGNTTDALNKAVDVVLKC